jgi:hypothetical protein
MEGGRRRARLTPMSGELRATEDWAYVEPADAKPEKRRKQEQLPQTTVGVLADGLRRFAVYGSVLVAAVTLGAYLVARLTGRHFAHVLTLAYYFTGAAFGAIAFLTTTGAGRTRSYSRTRSERELAFNQSFVLICFAALMVAIGVALELLL